MAGVNSVDEDFVDDLPAIISFMRFWIDLVWSGSKVMGHSVARNDVMCSLLDSVLHFDWTISQKMCELD